MTLVSQASISTDVLRFLELLWRPGDVREVRIPRHNIYGQTASGYFDSPQKLADAVATWDGRANIYVALNPVSSALLARAVNRVIEKAEKTTADADTRRRRWLLLDIDAVRPSGISSTEAELQAARSVLNATTAFLDDQGWPEPLIVMSGNGYYALFAIDLPNDSESHELVKGVLAALAAKLDSGRAHIDITVSNAARIVGLVGTLKVKGDSTPDRPHRRSLLESVPADFRSVSLEQLEAVAAQMPKAEPCGTAPSSGRVQGSLPDMLREHGIEYREQPADAEGFTWYHVRQCPFHDDGRSFECGVGQKLPNGALAGNCFHPEGDGKSWREWRIALGIGFSRNGHRRDLPRGDDGRPRILVSDRHLHEIAGDAWDAVLAANDPQRLFQRGASIVEVENDDRGRARISELTQPALKGYLDRIARWLRFSEKKGFVPARPPKDVVEDMMALAKPLPVLRGVIGTPVFAEDGTLVAESGYQDRTTLYYRPTGGVVPAIAECPSDVDVERAKHLLQEEWLGDFPFEGESSRTHAIAVALTAIVREMIDGPTPLFAIDAPTPGSGKGLLAETIGILASGAAPAIMTEGRNEEEMRKRITAALRDGSLVILLDNVSRRLDSGALAAVLTAMEWRDRILGRSEMIQVPNRGLWLCTGNNLELNSEIARRTVWVRLDPRVDRPWERTGFRHEPLTAWVRGHRHELVWALLTLAQRWVAEGQPPWEGRPLGSFEDWCRVVGGILDRAGVPDFLSNQEELYRRADAETEEWRAFVAAWWEEHGSQAVKAAHLIPLALEGDLLPSVFASVKEGASERALRTRLGKALSQRRDRRFANFFIRSLGQDSHRKGALYRLEVADSPEDEAQPSASSADVPHENGAISDTNAEGAEDAEPVSNARAREIGGNEINLSTANNVPQLPLVPQIDTDSADLGAEGVRKVARGLPHEVPQRFKGCGC